MLDKLIAGLPFIKPENKKAGLTAISFAWDFRTTQSREQTKRAECVQGYPHQDAMLLTTNQMLH